MNTQPNSNRLVPRRDANRRYGYVDTSGNLVIPYKYDHAYEFSEGLAAVRDENNGFGYINPKGETVIPHQYLNGCSFHEGIAIAVRNATDENILFLDTSGNALPIGNYSNASDCHNGTIAVKKNDRWGIIDKKGNIIIDIVYDKTFPFDSNGITSVKLNGKTFEITRDGEEYIQDL